MGSEFEKVSDILRQWFFDSRALPQGKGIDLEAAVGEAAREICQIFEPKQLNKVELEKEVLDILNANIKPHSMRYGMAVFTITSFEQIAEAICHFLETDSEAM